MGEGKRRKAAVAAGLMRPLTVMRDLGPVTRFALPPEIGQPTPEIIAYVQSLIESVRHKIRQRLMDASLNGKAEAVVEAIEAIGAETVVAYEAELLTRERSDPDFAAKLAQVDCRKGCAFCCHVNVTVTVLEAARVMGAIRTGRAPDRTPAVLATASGIGGLDTAARQSVKVPCPMLVEGACSAYESRPLSCRALLSQSADLCEHYFERVDPAPASAPLPTLVTPRLVGAGFISGQVAALQDLGLASHVVELTAALARIAQDPTALPRWLDRQDVFQKP